MYSLTATSLVKPTRIASAVSAVLLAATMQSAMAQSNENNAQNDADEDIEVITVASERRVKRVQDISASLTALSSADQLVFILCLFFWRCNFIHFLCC